MSDDQEKRLSPVLTGLVALIAVSLSVGLILGGVALVGTRMLGLGDESANTAGSSERESAVIPRPSKTSATGPQLTLFTEDPETEVTDDVDPEETKTKKVKEKKEITLQAGQNDVGNFDRIDLSGIYPGGEGAILQVQRFEGGQWVDFNATLSVSNESFSTYVQSALIGVNKFRVVDSATGAASNPVTVTVG